MTGAVRPPPPVKRTSAATARLCRPVAGSWPACDDEVRHGKKLKNLVRMVPLVRVEDEAVGHMEKNADGKLAITRIELRPKITWSGNPKTQSRRTR